MRPKTTKRINALLWFALVVPLSGILHADVSQTKVSDQTQTFAKKNDLSWPKDQLLTSSFSWQKHDEVAEKCLLVGRMETTDPTAMHLLKAVNLSGTRYAGVILDGTLRSWNFSNTLKNAGYSQQMPIPDKGIFLEGQQEALPHGSLTGYINGSEKKIRLILISTEQEDCSSVETSSIGHDCPSPRVEVFVSNITTLAQILKKTQ